MSSFARVDMGVLLRVCVCVCVHSKFTCSIFFPSFFRLFCSVLFLHCTHSPIPPMYTPLTLSQKFLSEFPLFQHSLLISFLHCLAILLLPSGRNTKPRTPSLASKLKILIHNIYKYIYIYSHLRITNVFYDFLCMCSCFGMKISCYCWNEI